MQKTRKSASTRRIVRTIACAFLPIAFATSAFAQVGSEQAEINAILREIEYLRERVLALEAKFGKSGGNATQKIRFNYQALIAQLRATENGIRDYLNARIDVIHTTPPEPVTGELYRVRRN